MEGEPSGSEIHTSVFNKEKCPVYKEKSWKHTHESFRDTSLAIDHSQIPKKRKDFQPLVSSALKKSEICDKSEKATSAHKKKQNGPLRVDKETGVMYVFVDKENIENMPKNCQKDLDVVYVDVSRVQKSTKGRKANRLHAVAKSNINEPEELHKKVKGRKNENCPTKATSWDAIQESQHAHLSQPQSESQKQPSSLLMDQEGKITELPASAHKDKAKKKKKKLSSPQKSKPLDRTDSPHHMFPEGSQVLGEVGAGEGSRVLKREKGSEGRKTNSKKRKRVPVKSTMESEVDFRVHYENSENTLFGSAQDSHALTEETVKPRPQKKSHEHPSLLLVDQEGEITELSQSAHKSKAKKKKKLSRLQESEALARPESPNHAFSEGLQVVSETGAGEGSSVFKKVKIKNRKCVPVKSVIASGSDFLVHGENSKNKLLGSAQDSHALIEGKAKPRPQKESHEQLSLLSVNQEGEITEVPQSAHKNKAKKKKRKLYNPQESEALAKPGSPNHAFHEGSQVVREMEAGGGSIVLKRVKIKNRSKNRKCVSVQGALVCGDGFSGRGENSENTLSDSVAGSHVLMEENVKETTQEEPAQSSSAEKHVEEAQRSEPSDEEESNLELAGGSVKLASDSRDSADSDVDLHSAVRQLQEFIPNIKERAPTTIKRMYRDDLERFREFKEQGVAIRFGKFSAKENKQLEENVQEFLSLTGIESADKLLYTDRYPEEKAAITDLKRKHAFRLHIGKGIARPWKLVYYRAKKIFDVNNYKGRYSKGDMEKLKACQSLHGNDWKKIGAMVSRSSLSVALKFSQIRSKRNHGVWSKAETRKLIKAVEEVILKKMSPQELNEMDSELQENPDSRLSIVREKLYKGISWVEVEAKVETRNWMQCKSKWTEILTKRMTNGGFVYRGIRALQAKVNLIERLYEINVEDVNEIDWEDLACAIGDVPPSYVQIKFYKLKAACVPFWQKKTFPEIIDYLYETSLPMLKEKLKKKMKKNSTEIPSPAAPKQVFLFRDIFYCEDDSEEEEVEEQS